MSIPRKTLMAVRSLCQNGRKTTVPIVVQNRPASQGSARPRAGWQLPAARRTFAGPSRSDGMEPPAPPLNTHAPRPAVWAWLSILLATVAGGFLGWQQRPACGRQAAGSALGGCEAPPGGGRRSGDRRGAAPAARRMECPDRRRAGRTGNLVRGACRRRGPAGRRRHLPRAPARRPRRAKPPGRRAPRDAAQRGGCLGRHVRPPAAREAAWAGQPVALPLGSPILVCYYRADLLDKLGLHPPETWPEYRQLAGRLQHSTAAGVDRYGSIEPLGPGWAGLTFLAHAAPMPSIRTITPRCSTSRRWSRSSPVRRSSAPGGAGRPGEIRAGRTARRRPGRGGAAFWQGRCGLAVGWPSAARPAVPLKVADAVRVGFCELPGAAEVYHPGNKSWEKLPEGTETRVPLLTIAGRLGVVARGGPRRDAAFQVLEWVSGPAWAGRIFAGSGSTTLFARPGRHGPRLGGKARSAHRKPPPTRPWSARPWAGPQPFRVKPARPFRVSCRARRGGVRGGSGPASSRQGAGRSRRKLAEYYPKAWNRTSKNLLSSQCWARIGD